MADPLTYCDPVTGWFAPPVTVVYERTPGRSMPTRSCSAVLVPRNQVAPVSARSHDVIGSPTKADALDGPTPVRYSTDARAVSRPRNRPRDGCGSMNTLVPRNDCVILGPPMKVSC